MKTPAEVLTDLLRFRAKDPAPFTAEEIQQCRAELIQGAESMAALMIGPTWREALGPNFRAQCEAHWTDAVVESMMREILATASIVPRVRP